MVQGNTPKKAEAKIARSHHNRKSETKSDVPRGRCSLCQRNHFVMLCDDYKKKTTTEGKQHVESSNLCVNCLGRHKVIECASKKNCTVCSERHHTSLHDAFRATEGTTSSHIAQRLSERHAVVLLATARVRLADRYGRLHPARALLDQGSETSLISARLAAKLKLPFSAVSVAVYGVGGPKTGRVRSRIDLRLSLRVDGPEIAFIALVLPQLIAYSGSRVHGLLPLPHLKGLQLAGPDFLSSESVDLILGVNVFAEILLPGLRKGTANVPIAQKTKLGWILSGPVDISDSGSRIYSLQCRTEEDLTRMVRKFWEQEEILSSGRALTEKERECKDHFARTHFRKPDGRYSVRLPLTGPLPDFANTRRIVLRALKAMEARFARDASFSTLYKEFMTQYTELGHMSEVSSVTNPESKRVCFLPHHGVLRNTSSSTSRI